MRLAMIVQAIKTSQVKLSQANSSVRLANCFQYNNNNYYYYYHNYHLSWWKFIMPISFFIESSSRVEKRKLLKQTVTTTTTNNKFYPKQCTIFFLITSLMCLNFLNLLPETNVHCFLRSNLDDDHYNSEEIANLKLSQPMARAGIPLEVGHSSYLTKRSSGKLRLSLINFLG